MMEWARLSDFYDNENMPNIQYFNSFEHLNQLLATVDTNSISNSMKEHNKQRKRVVYEKWKNILSKLED